MSDKAPAGYVRIEDFQAAVDCLNAHVAAMASIIRDIDELDGDAPMFSRETAIKVKECTQQTKLLQSRFATIATDRLKSARLDA